VSCDLETVKRRVALTAGTPLAVINANAAIAYDAMRAGSRGFTGVFTNFHPDLYKWLRNSGPAHPQLADHGGSAARGTVFPVCALPAHRLLAAGHAAGEPAGTVEREHVASLGKQVHHQYQCGNELLAGRIIEPFRIARTLV